MADVEVNKLDLSSPLVFLESKTVLDSLPEGIAGAHYVFHKGKLYVGGGMFGGEISNKLLIYTPADDSWVIISTPTKYYAITIYESELVLLGGEDLDIHATSSNSTNGNVWLYRNAEWVPHPKIPNLPFKISALCAVTFENRLIVATNGSDSDTTEIITFDGDNWKTAKATTLPENLPMLGAQSVLNGDTWYLSTADQLYCASLKSLVAASESETQLNDHPPVWTKLTALSSYFGDKTAHYGIAWFGSHLIAFETTTGVFVYDHLHDHWDHALDFSGVLPGSCYAVLPDGDLILVGGHGDCSPVKRVKHVYLKESAFPHGPLSMRALQHIDGEVHLFRNISKNSKKFIRETHVACLHNIPGKKLVEAFVGQSKQTPTWRKLRRVLNVIRMKKVSKRIKIFFQSESDDEGDCKKTVIDIYQDLEQALQGNVKKEPRLKVLMEKLEDKLSEMEDRMEQFEYEKTAEFNGQNKNKLLDSSFNSETSVETDSCHERATESTEQNGVVVQEKGLESIMYSETDEIDSGSEIVDLMEDKNSDDGITFVITNKKETFSSETYGFKLDVPQQCLPSDVSECSVNVKLANPEHFEFPENTVPASHIIQMQFIPSVTFVPPITLELTPQRKFALAIAKEDKKFITLPEEECFGIEITESDYYTVGVFISNDAATLASRASKDTLQKPSYYTGHIYYSTFRGIWDVYLLVTKNQESQRKAIEKFAEERTATLDGNFSVLFRGDKVSLDMQIEALPQDWKMVPLKTPLSIQLRDVNNFDENESLMVPHVHLKVSCKGEGIGEDLTHTMSFNETEKVTISLPRTCLPRKRPATDPCTDNAGTRKKKRLEQSGAGYDEEVLSSNASNTKDHEPPLDIMDIEPSFGNFVAFRWKHESGSIKYYRPQQTFCNNWRSLAHMFGIEQSIIDATSKKTVDQMERWESIVTHWLRNGSEPSDSYPTTWNGLIEALEAVGGYGHKIKELRTALKNRVKYIAQT